MAELCGARLEDRYGSSANRSEAQARLTQELNVIDRLGLAGFFLLHHDMLELAREVAVEVRGPESVRALLAPGRGRGSSVSSLVCYLIGLSHIDPIANRLTLGRFLHEDLRGLPDIDLDFPRDIREVLIPRVHERYGRDHAALVAAFPTFRARGAIRELGKVLGLPAGEIERMARGADRHGPGVEHDMAAGAGTGRRSGEPDPGGQAGPREARRFDPERWRWLARLVEEAYGLPRHLSQHSGGMIIATRPLIDCCPVVPAAMEGRQMVQWDKDSCADAGFLKIDLLGLGMLSAVERCVEMIARTRAERIDLSRIPFDDPQTFGAIREADTVGVFQIESRAQMQSLRRTRPANLEDLTIQVAIIRPGPIQGGAVNPYIERRRRLREDPAYEIPYEHPTLQAVLKDTLGTIIFQDQVMEVAEAFAGFTPGEADGLRRAMSRKRSLEMLQRHRERFIEGALRHADVEREAAERVWQMVEGFAGFGFPQGAQRRVRPARLPVDVAARPLRPGVPVRAAERAADGLLRPRQPRARGRAAGGSRLRLDVNASGGAVHGGGRRRAPGPGLHQGCDGRRDARAGGRARAKRTLPQPRRACRAHRRGRRTLEQLAWSGACDQITTGSALADLRSVGETGRRSALWQLGMAAPGLGAGEDTSSRCPWSCRRRRACARSGAGSG